MYSGGKRGAYRHSPSTTCWRGWCVIGMISAVRTGTVRVSRAGWGWGNAAKKESPDGASGLMSSYIETSHCDATHIGLEDRSEVTDGTCLKIQNDWTQIR